MVKLIKIPSDIQLTEPNGVNADGLSTFKKFLTDCIKLNKEWMNNTETLGRGFVLIDKINAAKGTIEMDDEDYTRILNTYSLKGQDGNPILNPNFIFQTRPFFDALTKAVDPSKVVDERKTPPKP